MANTTKSEMRKLVEGDEFFIKGVRYIASTDAHTFEQAGYENDWVVYDEEGNSWFEEDFSDDDGMEVGAMFEIRVYYSRYNIDSDYYLGNKGIKRKWKAKTVEELIKKWAKHLDEFEGDTYSVWEGDECIIGGVYDPNDYLEICDQYDISEDAAEDMMRGLSTY